MNKITNIAFLRCNIAIVLDVSTLTCVSPSCTREFIGGNSWLEISPIESAFVAQVSARTVTHRTKTLSIPGSTLITKNSLSIE